MKKNYNFGIQEMEDLSPAEFEIYYYMALADWKQEQEAKANAR